jgi:hypothetical protein
LRSSGKNSSLEQKRKNTELESRLASRGVVEQDSQVVDEQPQNAKEVKTEESTVDVHFMSPSGDSVLNNANTKSREAPKDEKVEAFLIDQRKKSVSDEITQRKRKKNLMRDTTNQETPLISQNPASTTCHERKNGKGLIQEMTSSPKKIMRLKFPRPRGPGNLIPLMHPETVCLKYLSVWLSYAIKPLSQKNVHWKQIKKKYYADITTEEILYFRRRL